MEVNENKHIIFTLFYLSTFEIMYEIINIPVSDINRVVLFICCWKVQHGDFNFQIIPVIMCLTFTIAILSFGDLTFIPVIMIEEFLRSPTVGNNSAVSVEARQPKYWTLLLQCCCWCRCYCYCYSLLLLFAWIALSSLLWDGEDGSVANWVPVANCSRTSSEKQNENVSWE